jgi:CelD/BcsL family acetyltransferase involved in cellulose biosynthesis
MLTVEYIDDVAAFTEMAPAWNALLRETGANSVFLTWEWLGTWWRHLGGSRRLSIVGVRSARELVGLLPVALDRSWLGHLKPVPQLESLGIGSVGSDYLDVIAKRGWEDRVLETLSDELGRQGVSLRMAQVEPRSALATRLAARLGRAGWGIARFGTQRCPYIRLAGQTWASYEASLGSEHRYNFRRRLKNLEQTGSFRFERVVCDEQRGEVLSTLVRLNHERWQKRGGSQAFHKSDLLAFHEDFTRLALARGWLRLYALRLEGGIAAALYGLCYNGVFSFYQSAFDPREARRSVGLVAMGLSIRSALEEHAVEYDMLHGDEPYKFLWCREAREVLQLEMYPATPRGRAAEAVAEALRDARRTARRLLPPRVREAFLTARSGRGLDATPAR